LRDFLEAALLKGTQGDIWISSLRNSDESGEGPDEVHVKTRDLDKIEAFAKKWDRPGRGLFLCVATISHEAKSRNKKSALENPLLHIDIDQAGDPEIRMLLSLPAKPSAIVRSGHGVHAYWFLQQPGGAEVEATLKRLAKEFQSDSKVAQRVALMRLPGTHNTKRGEWTEVTLVHFQPELRWLPGEVTGEATNPFLDYRPVDEAMDVEAILAAMDHGNIHDTQVRVSASMLNAGATEDAVVERLMEATQALEGTAHWDWEREEQGLRDMCRTWAAKLDQEAKDEEKAIPAGAAWEDFTAFKETHKFIYRPNGKLWPSATIDDILPKMRPAGGGKPVKASVWLTRYRSVEDITWAPGLPKDIANMLVLEGGWEHKDGVRIFNQYNAPKPPRPTPHKADRWLEHLRTIYPEDWQHILMWMAHRVQRPGDKVNHALLLGGDQGIGKDTLLAPVRKAVGEWNWKETTPKQMMATGYNRYVQAVVLRVSEAQDLGDKSDRFKFYEYSKTLTASPPEMLQVSEKYMPAYYIPNVVGVIMTTNHQTDGIYLAPDDRRTYAAWSPCTRGDFGTDYWEGMWGYYDEGGYDAIAAHLRAMDIRMFRPKAPPKQTDYFWMIVNSNQAPESSEMADALDRISNPWPQAVTVKMLADAATQGGNVMFAEWLEDRKNHRIVPHRLSEVGYVPIRSDGTQDGRWVIEERRQMVYAKATLSLIDQKAAAKRLQLRVVGKEGGGSP
jgi:hypothetical protein